MIRIHTVILVSCVVLLLTVFGTAAAQETTTTFAPTETTAAAAPTTASEPLSKTTYYGNVTGGRAAQIVSTEYVDRTIMLVLESDLPWTVTATAPTDSTSTGAAAGNLVRKPIPPGWTTIQTDPPEPRVTLVTSYSARNGRYTKIRFDDGGSALIAGPFTGTGVRDAAVGGVLGTLFGALLIIVRWRFGFHRNMEHVA